MKKVHVLVEGQTEEKFVNTVLADYLCKLKIYLIPIIVATKRVKSGGKFRGGVTSYKKVKDEILRLLQDSSSVAVTTMIDFYALPEDINDNPETVPSKRIFKLFPEYDKVADGPIIAQRIGMEVLRDECPHFNDWVTFIENL